MSEVICDIECGMFERVTKEEMVDATNLEDDSENARRYTKGRMECEDET